MRSKICNRQRECRLTQSSTIVYMKSKTIHVKVDEKAHKELTARAADQKRTLSSLAAYALSRFIAEKEK